MRCTVTSMVARPTPAPLRLASNPSLQLEPHLKPNANPQSIQANPNKLSALTHAQAAQLVEHRLTTNRATDVGRQRNIVEPRRQVGLRRDALAHP